MKLTFHDHLAKGISKLFRYTSFANTAHFISAYEKHMPLTNDGLTIEQTNENVYRLTIDFGNMVEHIILVFSSSGGRIILQEIK